MFLVYLIDIQSICITTIDVCPWLTHLSCYQNLGRSLGLFWKSWFRTYKGLWNRFWVL